MSVLILKPTLVYYFSFLLNEKRAQARSRKKKRKVSYGFSQVQQFGGAPDN